MKEITVTFDGDTGNPTVEVSGIKGKGCKDLTAALEKALGKVTSDVHTNEYAQAPEVKQVQGVRH